MIQGKYIESISEQVRPFGICKIVPPPTWKPPFMIDPKAFTVRTRVQQVNYLDGQARQRLIFVENLCRFWLCVCSLSARTSLSRPSNVHLCRRVSRDGD